MKRRAASSRRIAKLFLFALCLTLALTAGDLRPGLTQEPEKRKLKIHTFNRMPLKVKQIKNLQREDDGWFRDLEIEVENVSDKPIYYIRALITFPDIPMPPPQRRADGSMPSRVVVGSFLLFGPPRLGDVKNLATSDDIALKPGETYVFKITEQEAGSFEAIKRMYYAPLDAVNKMELEFNTISFGDGTGYIAHELRVYPKKKNSDKPQGGECSGTTG